jgi:ATP-dependent RNA helicase RhlE
VPSEDAAVGGHIGPGGIEIRHLPCKPPERPFGQANNRVHPPDHASANHVILPSTVVRVGIDGPAAGVRVCVSSTWGEGTSTLTNQNKNEARPAEGGFAPFEFPAELERGIAAMGFTQPRPIQLATIPAALAGEDVLGLAETGTGKTAAFALPMLDLLLEEPSRKPRGLVIAPTRELATQIDAEIRSLARFTKLRTTVIYGGVPMSKQIRALAGQVDIIVACPGRLIDLIERRAVKLDAIECLVLDEADHMFDMGFLPGIRRILAELPRDRQNLLFSATMPQEIRRLADEVLHRPHVVQLSRSQPASTIDHALYPVHPDRKRDLLEHFLRDAACTSAIVFTRTKHRAKRLAQQLEREGHRAVALQGNMSQAQRDRAMAGFRAKRFDVLVATDLVARGIDIEAVSHVINYDAPGTPEAYTHRIGRTGRSERSGIACTFVTYEDRAWVMATEKLLGNSIPRRDVVGMDTGATNMSSAVTIVRAEPAKPSRNARNGRPPQGQGQRRNGSAQAHGSRSGSSSSRGRRRSPRAAQG